MRVKFDEKNGWKWESEGYNTEGRYFSSARAAIEDYLASTDLDAEMTIEEVAREAGCEEEVA